MKKNNKKGFTLVELVIVIAVIAVLSAILVPTFGKVISDANENARREDARIAYQNFIIEHSEDDNAGKDAYIIFTKDSIDVDNSISGSKISYLYSVKNGTISMLSDTEFKTFKTEFTDSGDLKVKSKPDDSIVSKTEAYSLGKTGMYIVFAA